METKEGEVELLNQKLSDAEKSLGDLKEKMGDAEASIKRHEEWGEEAQRQIDTLSKNMNNKSSDGGGDDDNDNEINDENNNSNDNDKSVLQLTNSLTAAERTIQEFQVWSAGAHTEMQNRETQILALQQELHQKNNESTSQLDASVDIAALNEELKQSAAEREQLLLELANERKSNATDFEDLSEQMTEFFMEFNNE